MQFRLPLAAADRCGPAEQRKLIVHPARQEAGVVLLDNGDRGSAVFGDGLLEAIRGPGGLRIEPDLYWTPKPLKDCR